MKRIVQTAYCCDRVFTRRCLASVYYADAEARKWLPRRGRTGARPLQCPECGAELNWRRSPGASEAVRYYRRRRERNLLAGLTAHGAVRRRRAVRTASDNRRIELEKYRRRAERNTALGLTTRGTARKVNRFGRPCNPVEIAWRELRGSMPERSGPETIKERWE